MYCCYCCYEGAQCFVFKPVTSPHFHLPRASKLSSGWLTLQRPDWENSSFLNSNMALRHAALHVEHENPGAVFKDLFLPLVHIQYWEAFMTASTRKHWQTEGGSKSLWRQKKKPVLAMLITVWLSNPRWWRCLFLSREEHFKLSCMKDVHGLISSAGKEVRWWDSRELHA